MSTLNGSQLATLIILGNHSTIPRWQIAGKLGLTVRQTHRIIHALADMELIKIHHRFIDHRQRPNRYKVLCDVTPNTLIDISLSRDDYNSSPRVWGDIRGILSLIVEIATRLKEDPTKLFIAVWKLKGRFSLGWRQLLTALYRASTKVVARFFDGTGKRIKNRHAYFIECLFNEIGMMGYGL